MKKFSIYESNLQNQHIPCGVDYLLNKIKIDKPVILHRKVNNNIGIGYDEYHTWVIINGFKYSILLEKHFPLLPPILIINHYQLKNKNSEFLKVFKNLPLTDYTNFTFFYDSIPDSKITSFLEYLNEYKALKGNTVYLDRLKDVLYMIDMEDKFNFDTLNSKFLVK